MRNWLDTFSPQPQSRSGEEGAAGDGGAALRREMGHTRGAAASWAAAAAAAVDGLHGLSASTSLLSPPSLPAVWEHRLSHYSCLKKGPMCTGQTTSKWHLLCLAGASSFLGTCLQPCCSGTLWGHLPPAPDLNMACGPVIISQLCFSTAL